jgi:hypothetical protein
MAVHKNNSPKEKVRGTFTEKGFILNIASKSAIRIER